MNEMMSWRRFSRVTIEPTVVCSFGSWDPRNDNCLKRICSQKYSSLMRKLIVGDNVRASRNIFYNHVSRFPQVDVCGWFGAAHIAPTDNPDTSPVLPTVSLAESLPPSPPGFPSTVYP